MTKTNSGGFAILLAILSTLPLVGNAVAQANYPERPIRLIVAFPPGGPSDIVARLMADKLTEALGRPAVVENVSGASGNIGTERVAKSTPDGHTLLISAPGPLVVNPSLFQKVPFDPVRDFAPISQLCYTPNVLVVNNDVPVKSVQELIALARKNPGELSFASGGAGTSNHLAAELFKFMAGINLQHVPYRGVSVSVPDIIGGRIPVAFLSMATALPLVRDGKLRALAVGTSTRWPRCAGNPDHGRSRSPRLYLDGVAFVPGAGRNAARDPRSPAPRDHANPRAAGCAKNLQRPRPRRDRKHARGICRRHQG